jgi:hypothetical protein
VITQRHQAQFATTELTPQVPLHTGQVTCLGGDVQRIDHHLGGLIRRQRRQQLTPQLPPGLTGQQVVLQLGAQQGPGFTAQALDHMAEINPPQWAALASSAVQSRQCFHELAAQEQIQPVMAQMHGELFVGPQGPVVALAAVLPVAPIGGSSPHQGPKPITVDVHLQLPAAGQIEPHSPPPDLTPGLICQEGLPRQNGQQGLLDLGGAATAQGEQSG